MNIGWGIIGLGRVVRESIAPGIAVSQNSRLVACAGRDFDKTREIARELGAVRTHRTHEELVSDPDVDVVYVATPNALHKQAVLTAARARKHVLCEKPFALTVEDARAMQKACADAGVILRVAFQIRLEKMLHRVREIIASGALGELRSVSFERTARITQPGAWRNDPQQGGIVFDVATHLLDLVPWLTGLPYREVFAVSSPDRREGKAEDTIAIVARLGERCNAVVRASRELPYAKNDLIVEGTRGVLSTSGIRWLDEYWLEVEDDSGTRKERFAPTRIYDEEIVAMEGELRGVRSLLPDADEAIRMIEIANAIFESIETRCSVEVKHGV